MHAHPSSSFIHPLPVPPLHTPAPCLSWLLSAARLIAVISKQPPAKVACSSDQNKKKQKRHLKQHRHALSAITWSTHAYLYMAIQTHTKNLLHSTPVSLTYKNAYTCTHTNQPSTLSGADIQIDTQKDPQGRKSICRPWWGWYQRGQENSYAAM